MPTDTLARARRVRLLTCDVDGVLTDGSIYVDDHGHEMKAFSALDGVGLNLLARAGIVVAWITGSAAPAVDAPRAAAQRQARGARRRRQARRVGGAARGARDSRRTHARTSATTCRTCRCCTPAASRSTVPHAPAAVREHAHYVTAREGGAGAVRELAELILAAQGHTFAGSAAARGLTQRTHGPRNPRPLASSTASPRGRRCCCSAASPRSPTGSTRRCSRPRRAATAPSGTTPTSSSRASGVSSTRRAGRRR